MAQAFGRLDLTYKVAAGIVLGFVGLAVLWILLVVVLSLAITSHQRSAPGPGGIAKPIPGMHAPPRGYGLPSNSLPPRP